MARSFVNSKRLAIAAVVVAGQLASSTACASPVVEGDSPARWDEHIAPYAKFVSTTYGRPWDHPVRVRFLSDSSFDAIAGIAGPAEGQPATWQDKALGFRETDPAEAFGAGNAGTVLLGVYQPSSDALLVRGRRIDETNERVIVHELTHALQAQLLVDETPPAVTDPDRDLAATAVFEGDATSIEASWAERLPADATEEAAVPFDTPAEILQFGGTGALRWWETLMPYSTGWRFVETALQRGPATKQRLRLLRLANQRRLTSLDVLTLNVESSGSDPAETEAAEAAVGSNSETDATDSIPASSWYALVLGLGGDPRTTFAGITEAVTGRHETCTDQVFLGPTEATERVRAALANWATAVQSPTATDGPAKGMSLSWCDNNVQTAPTTVEHYLRALTADEEAAALLRHPVASP
jgi:hypothetical protein